MPRLVTLVALALLPLAAAARSTDTSHQVINLSAGEDDATTAWRNDHAKLATSGDDVHVLWVAQPSVGGNQRLIYTRSTDGGLSFEAPLALAPLAQNPQLEATSLTLAVDGSSVYAVYHEGWPVNLRFTRSLDRGVTWEAPRALATHHWITRHVVVAAQGGTVAVAWNLTMDDAPPDPGDRHRCQPERRHRLRAPRGDHDDGRVPGLPAGHPVSRQRPLRPVLGRRRQLLHLAHAPVPGRLARRRRELLAAPAGQRRQQQR